MEASPYANTEIQRLRDLEANGKFNDRVADEIRDLRQKQYDEDVRFASKCDQCLLVICIPIFVLWMAFLFSKL